MNEDSPVRNAVASRIVTRRGLADSDPCEAADSGAALAGAMPRDNASATNPSRTLIDPTVASVPGNPTLGMRTNADASTPSTAPKLFTKYSIEMWWPASAFSIRSTAEVTSGNVAPRRMDCGSSSAAVRNHCDAQNVLAWSQVAGSSVTKLQSIVATKIRWDTRAAMPIAISTSA